MHFLIQINGFEHLSNPPKPAETPRGYKPIPNQCIFLFKSMHLSTQATLPNRLRHLEVTNPSQINTFSYSNQCIRELKEPAQSGWDASRLQTHPKSMLFLIQINAFEHVRNPPKPAEMPRGYKTNLNRCFLLYEHIWACKEPAQTNWDASRPQKQRKSMLSLIKFNAFEHLKKPSQTGWNASRPQPPQKII